MERNPDEYRAYSNNGKDTPESFQKLIVQPGHWLDMAGVTNYAPLYIRKQLEERSTKLVNVDNSRQTFIRDSAPVTPTDLNSYWAGLPDYGRNKS